MVWKGRLPDLAKAVHVLRMGQRFLPLLGFAALIRAGAECLASVERLYRADTIEGLRTWNRRDVFSNIRATVYLSIVRQALSAIATRAEGSPINACSLGEALACSYY